MTATDWKDSIPSLAEWGDGIAQPYDDAPFFDPTEAPEVDTVLRLNGDRGIITKPRRRLFIDYRPQPDAYRHLEIMPGKDETLHGVISGKYALFELIPALIERTAQPIKALTIATLSFNRQNATDILDLFDEKQISNISLLISYYYKSTSREIYDTLVPPLRDRGQRVLAIRNHAKLLLAEMADGTKYTVESSANLRSSVNIEQFAMSQSDELYKFHIGWIDELFSTRKDMGKD